jgi:hypothetical protein
MHCAWKLQVHKNFKKTVAKCDFFWRMTVFERLLSCPFFRNDPSFNDLIKGCDFSENTYHTVLPTPAHYNLQLINYTGEQLCTQKRYIQ